MGLWLGCTPPEPPALRPRFEGSVPTNLLMLSVDTLRKAHVGHHGGGALTPFLDRLGVESVVADDAMACSNWTVASTACVLAGAGNLDLAAARGTIPMASAAGVLSAIPEPEPMLPQWLGDHGFQSVLVTTNGFFSDAHGNAQGYDVVDYRGPGKVLDAWRRARRLLVDGGSLSLTSPWFVHLHFFEPHRPYTPPAGYLAELADLPQIPFDLSSVEGQRQAVSALGELSPSEADAVRAHMRVRYAAEVRFFDEQLSVLWRELDALGMLDDTLVVLWSDHGEELWEHGVTEHGRYLHAEENDALLWFWARDIVPETVRGPVHHNDVAPTLLALWDLPLPGTTTGIPLGRAPSDRVRFAMADAYAGPVIAVRQGRHKLQFRWEDHPVRVFDVVADPGEQEDLFDPDDAVARELWARLRPRIEAVAPYVEQDPRGFELVWPAHEP